MAYNSAYTGSQVDAAVGAVRQKETKWDNKQDELTGTEDQLVGFNSAGEAVAVAKPDPLPTGGETGQVLTKTSTGAQWEDIPSDLPAGGTDGQILTKTADGSEWSDAPSGLPDGGTPGQMLYQGESGPEWGDKPVMYVNITESSGTYSADKTAQEIYEAFSDGCAVYAVVMSEAIIPIYNASFYSGVYSTVFSFSVGGAETMIIITSETGVQIGTNNIGANKISFTPGSTGLESTNVQDAIEEVNAKAKPKSVSVTLSASGWASNAKTVTVSGVLADETKQLIQPMPAVASQSAYIEAGIICTAQAADQLTFTCSTVPTADLQVYVVIQEVIQV